MRSEIKKTTIIKPSAKNNFLTFVSVLFANGLLFTYSRDNPRDWGCNHRYNDTWFNSECFIFWEESGDPVNVGFMFIGSDYPNSQITCKEPEEVFRLLNEVRSLSREDAKTLTLEAIKRGVEYQINGY